jgi:hypothetical protein
MNDLNINISYKKFNPREWHHGYLGIALCIISLFMSGWAAFITGLIGGFIFSDDVVYEIKGWSLLHTAYSYFYHKHEWIRDVNRWFDNLFGKKY